MGVRNPILENLPKGGASRAALARKLLGSLVKAAPAERLCIADRIAALDPDEAVLDAALSNSDWHIRWGAAHALGRRSRPAALGSLRRLLKDPQPRVARTAAWALGRMRDPESTEDLVSALHSTNSHLSAAAAWALGRIGTTGALEALASGVENSSNRTRRSVAIALHETGADAIPLLERALREGTFQTRTLAASALSKLGSPAAKAVLPLLSSDEVKQRRAAAHLLGTVRWPTAGKPDQSGSKNVDLELRVEAEEALTRALKDGDLRVRCSAARSLASLNALDAVDSIESLLSGGSEEVRVAANALAELDDKQASGSLRAVFEQDRQDISEEARSAVLRALERLGAAPAPPKKRRSPESSLKSRTDFLAYVPEGLEAVAWEEISERMPGASLQNFGGGQIRFTWKGSPQAAAVLRSVKQVLHGGAQASEISLAKRLRRYRVRSLPASIEPTTAFCASRLASTGKDDVFVDLTCGSATLAIERALDRPFQTILAGDNSLEALESAAENVKAGSQCVQLIHWDACQLPLANTSVNAIAANLPYGRRSGTHASNLELYPALVSEVSRVLRRGGTAVLMTTERKLMRECLKERTALQLVSEQQVEAGGLKPSVFVIQKS